MNSYMQVKLPDPFVQLKSNDNAITVSGQTESGYVSKSILSDDPEAEAKVTALVDDMQAHQRALLVEVCGEQAPALTDFDGQMETITDDITNYFNAKTEGE